MWSRQECKEWVRYITDFFNQCTPENVTNTVCENEIDRGGVYGNLQSKKALHQVKSNKSPGPKQIPAELSTSFNKIYNEGTI